MKEKLTEQELSLIKMMTRSGESLNRISTRLKKSKTTVYYHFRKIRGRTVNPITVQSNNQKQIGEFMGLFAGDGSFDKTSDYKYRIRLHFNITEGDFIKSLINNCLLPLFANPPMVFDEKNKFTLCYYSKNIYALIISYLTWSRKMPKTYSVHLKKSSYCKDFMTGFIRGSLDSDGYLSSKSISFATVSPGLRDNICLFLDKLGYSYSSLVYKDKRPNRVDIFHVNIHKSNFKRFLMNIEPRNKRGLNAPAGIRISER